MEIGQRSSCGPQILGHPATDGRVKGSTAIPRGHVDFAKTRNFRCDSCEKKKFDTICSALAQIILLICPICLFIQFSFFLVDDLVSNYGQQFVFQKEDKFSSCH